MEVRLAFTPFAHQRAANTLVNAVRFVVLVWHRRAGKTVFAIIRLILAALRCQLPMGRYGYVDPELKQAKRVAWAYLVAFSAVVPGVRKNETELWVEFPNGARIQLYGADQPDALRGGYFDGIVLDEVADLKPDVWSKVILPALADRRGWALFIGTAKGVNLFSQLHYAAAQGAPGWATDVRRASETGVIPEEELALCRGPGGMTAQEYAQEWECDFSAAVDNVLVSYVDVMVAQKRSLAEGSVTPFPKVLGIDVARYGDGRSALFPRQGPMAWKPTVLSGVDLMGVADQAAFFIDRWKPDAVFIDQGGVGGGVIDRLRQLRYTVTGVDFGGTPLDPRFQNKRAEMWWEMASWFKGEVAVPSMQELTVDLTAPRYTYKNAAGKLQLESKDSMRERGLKSPDLGDSLALTFAAPVPIRSLLDKARDEQREQAAARGRSPNEYDPFAERRT